jgi:hypothetical protein
VIFVDASRGMTEAGRYRMAYLALANKAKSPMRAPQSRHGLSFMLMLVELRQRRKRCTVA